MTAAPSEILDPDIPFNQRLLHSDVQKTLTQLEAVNFGPVHELVVNAGISLQADDLTSNERIDDLKNVLRGVIKQQQRLDNHKQALVMFASQLDNIPYEQLCNPDYDWNTPIAESIRQVSDSKQSLHARQLELKLLEFQQEINGAESSAEEKDIDIDEDVIIEREVEYTKCPITQQLLNDAMKSTKCGHKYSKAGIDSLLARRSVMPCPVSGCKQTVSSECLRRCHRTASQRIK